MPSRTAGAHAIVILEPNHIALEWYLFDEDLPFLLNLPDFGHDTDKTFGALTSQKEHIQQYIQKHLYFKISNQAVVPEITSFSFEPPTYWNIQLTFPMPRNYLHEEMEFFYNYPTDLEGKDRLTMAVYDASHTLVNTLYLHRNFKAAEFNLPEISNRMQLDSIDITKHLFFNLMLFLLILLTFIPFRLNIRPGGI